MPDDDEAVRLGREEALIVPVPINGPGDPPIDGLDQLDLAMPKQDPRRALFAEKKYEAFIRELSNADLDPDEANDEGCAWALLARGKPADAEQWRASIRALMRSCELAEKAAGRPGGKRDLQRARKNLELVRAARRMAATT